MESLFKRINPEHFSIKEIEHFFNYWCQDIRFLKNETMYVPLGHTNVPMMPHDYIFSKKQFHMLREGQIQYRLTHQIDPLTRFRFCRSVIESFRQQYGHCKLLIADVDPGALTRFISQA